MLLPPSCPKCKSQNYKEKFPELEDIVQQIIKFITNLKMLIIQNYII